MNIRQERINELLRQEISKLILRDIKDPRLGFITVNKVETNKDLTEAKVLITVMGKESDVRRSLLVLDGAKEYIRVQISKKIKMKNIPSISFAIDTELEKTLDLLHAIKEDKEKHGY